MNQEEELTKPLAKEKLSQVIDAEPKVVVNETLPELAGEYEYASFFTRVGARLIDIFLYFIIYIALVGFVISPLVQMQMKVTDKQVNDYTTLLNDKINNLVQNNSSFDLTDSIEQRANPDCNFLFGSNTENNDLCVKISSLNRQTVVISSIVLFVISVAYFILTALSKWQGSVGKKLFKIKVVNSNNQKVSLLQSFAREAFWIAQGLSNLIGIFYTQASLLYLILLSVIVIDALRINFSAKKQSIHDYLADTYVVKLKEEF
jgi:uncharacterized RDD family membrane protein YckC